jgi:hypothetical protein
MKRGLHEQGHVACIREMKNMYRILVRKHEMKNPLGIGIDGRIIL